MAPKLGIDNTKIKFRTEKDGGKLMQEREVTKPNDKKSTTNSEGNKKLYEAE